MTAPRLPVTVIGGYLGAGKTTLVNNLLRGADGRRLAVLVNDFGAVPIDRDLIVASDGDTVELAGGCVCCNYGSDLMEALANLPVRLPGIEGVVLEASGVALPGMVASAVTLLPVYRTDGVVVLADAGTVRERADDAYLGDTIRRQLEAADLVVLNRCDLVEETTREALATWLSQEVPHARAVTAVRADIAPDLVLGLRETRHDRPSSILRTLGAPDAAALYESVEVAVPVAVDAEALARRLTAPGLGLLRAKAIVDGADGRKTALHVVGGRYGIDPAPAGARTGRLVAIGLRGRLDVAALRSIVQD